MNYDKNESPQRAGMTLTHDDLNSVETVAYAQEMKQAQSAPLIRPVGEVELAQAAWYRGGIVQMGIAGLLGGVLAWLLTELTTAMMPDDVSTFVSNMTFTVVIGFAIGLVMASWDGIMARSPQKVLKSLKTAVPVMLGTTVAFGLLANWIYTSWIGAISEDLYRKAIAFDWTETQIVNAFGSAAHLPRGVAWAIIGLAVGLGLGLASRQRQRVINGAIGGVLGGFIGGFMFDFFPGEVSARAFGIAVTGLVIGLAIGLVEVARRQHWLEIVSGGMAGKQFILYSQLTTVGSGPLNDVTLIKDPAIAETHAYLEQASGGLTIKSADPMHPTLINGVPVSEQELADGNMVQLGSTMLRYRDKAADEAVSGPIVG